MWVRDIPPRSRPACCSSSSPAGNDHVARRKSADAEWISIEVSTTLKRQSRQSQAVGHVKLCRHPELRRRWSELIAQYECALFVPLPSTLWYIWGLSAPSFAGR